MRIFIPIASLLALTACGTAPDAATNGSMTEAATPTETASETASAETPQVNCSNLPPADDKPDNDIMNIDIGMAADDVIRIANCNKDGMAVAVTEDKSVSLPDGTRPRGLVEMKKGGDVVRAFLIGLPGQEKVIGLVRVSNFAAGKEPVIEQMRQQLTDKYGPLIATSEGITAGNPNELAQSFTPDAQPIPANRIGNTECAYYFGQNSDLGQVQPVCGYTKKIAIRPKYGNDALAGGFSIWLGDQSGYVAEARREVAAIQAMHAQARDAERQKAATSNRVPKL